jgi:hypothetical protein
VTGLVGEPGEAPKLSAVGKLVSESFPCGDVALNALPHRGRCFHGLTSGHGSATLHKAGRLTLV